MSHRNYAAVVVVYEAESEIDSITDIVNKYKDAPLKIFIGNSETGKAAGYNAKSFTMANLSGAIASL
jgi:hypothetical protein